MAAGLGRLIWCVAAIWLALAAAGHAQRAMPVLTVDQDRLFDESLWGKRSAAELEAEGRAIIAENQRLDKELSTDEAELTRLRETLDTEEFRKRAEEFDARATAIRRERAMAVQDLTNRIEADQNAFYQAATPILREIMQNRQAVVVLDRRSVLVSADAIDITDELIAELDARIGEGPLPQPETPLEPPEAN